MLDYTLTSVFIHRHTECSGEGEVATCALNQRVVDTHVKPLCVPDDGAQLACGTQGLTKEYKG